MLAAPAAETGAGAKVRTPWQVLSAKTDVDAVPYYGWAANRLWIVGRYRGVPTLHSARVSGGRLTNVAQARVPADPQIDLPFHIIDGELLVPTPAGGAPGYVMAPLLADGRLGAVKVVPYDALFAPAKEVAGPKLALVSIRDGIRVGGRLVWVLDGTPECHSINGCDRFFLACCSQAGAAVDLTRFIDRRHGVLFFHIGRDARGRIWLAWLDNRDYPHAARGVARILELEPSTLAPGSNAVPIPGVVADRIELACAASCRLVAQTEIGDIVSWGPGEGSPTRVASHWECGKGYPLPRWLLAASYRLGHLVVASWGSRGKTKYCDATVRDDIEVVSGDARGARARVVGAIPVATAWPPQNVSGTPSGPLISGTFAPTGLVAFETFQYTSGAFSPLVGALVPFGR